VGAVHRGYPEPNAFSLVSNHEITNPTTQSIPSLCLWWAAA
jgi:hypothetical protein